PPLMGADVGDICHPGNVRCGNIELPVQNIGGHVMRDSTLETGTTTIAHLSTPAAAAASSVPRDGGYRIRPSHISRDAPCGSHKPGRCPPRTAPPRPTTAGLHDGAGYAGYAAKRNNRWGGLQALRRVCARRIEPSVAE